LRANANTGGAAWESAGSDRIGNDGVHPAAREMEIGRTSLAANLDKIRSERD
jgi:hypothetical protein